jgi:hypothetical protein
VEAVEEKHCLRAVWARARARFEALGVCVKQGSERRQLKCETEIGGVEEQISSIVKKRRMSVYSLTECETWDERNSYTEWELSHNRR